jgi:hypothetical protein
MSEPLVFPAPSETTTTVNPQSDAASGVLPPSKLDPESSEKDFEAKQKQELEENLNKWLPSGDDALPEAPSEPAKEPAAESKEPARAESKERKAAGAEKHRKTVREPEAASGESDPLDEFSPHPQASEKTKSSFGELKQLTKGFRDRCKALESFVHGLGYEIPNDPEQLSPTLEKIRSEIQARLQSGLAPEVQTELESLRTLARSVGVLADDNFTRDYVAPVNAAYRDVIEEMCLYFDADPAQIKAEFKDPLLASGKFNPSNLPPDWWDSQVELMSKAPPRWSKERSKRNRTRSPAPGKP